MAGEMEIVVPYSDIDSGKVLNKEGLLELCNQIKTEIANNSGGSEVLDWSEPLFSVLSSGLVQNFSLGKNIGSYTSIANLAAALKQNKIAATGASFGYTSFSIKSLNDKMGTNYAGRKFSIDFTSSTQITSNYYTATSTANINTNERKALGLIIVGDEIWCVNGGLGGLRSLFGSNLSQLLQLKTYNAANYTNSRLDQAIYQLDTAISSKQDAIIPAAPTTDGTYTLQCVVSSGTPTYSWVSV